MEKWSKTLNYLPQVSFDQINEWVNELVRILESSKRRKGKQIGQQLSWILQRSGEMTIYQIHNICINYKLTWVSLSETLLCDGLLWEKHRNCKDLH